ncbi:MAG TPA: hypothetical protein VM537_17665 [Anaerolineae bacterium]|nr:hypothetical protein [Anaerolineae bacterium]
MKTNIATLEAKLEAALNDFDPSVRAGALTDLLALAEEGAIPLQPPSEVANMHCHTFFSFNAYGYSPTALAWLAKRRGFKLMGSVEFDVLDSVDEFLDACHMAGVRASTGLETRVFLPQFITRETNSPGEPGIYYHMGIGFTTSEPGEPAATILASMREGVRQRNLGVMERVNSYLHPVVIDYERDVLPLTPSGNATERHMVVAYLQAAQRLVPDPARFWAAKLHLADDRVAALMEDGPSLQGLIRSKLMKRGGVAYVQPGPESFPSLDRFHEMVNGCDALICATWLDGLSKGEQAFEELLDLLVGKGAVALNIVPDRNWNVADPELRSIKLRNLYEVVKLAQELSLPLNVGTEMNSFGQKVIDDFDAPELAPVREQFLDGAYFAYGHTMMQRQLGLGYHSEWARARLSFRPERNEFYRRIGYQVEPGRQGSAQLQRLDPAMSPEQMLESTGS